MRFPLTSINVRRLLPAATTVEHCFVVWAVFNDLITARSAVYSRMQGGANEHSIDGSEERICRLSF